MDLTSGTLLGGRVIYRQPRVGYRTGIEPVLLAASVAARPGERVLEAGTGAGAGLLCLLARVPGVAAVGIERDGALADLAGSNLAANGAIHGSVIKADVLDIPASQQREWTPFDHAMANPPWHDECGTASPNGMRDRSKRATPTLLANWAAVLAGLVRPGGSVTLIVPASSCAAAIDAVTGAGCGDVCLLPLWPRVGQEARLLLVRGLQGTRGPCRVHPGLVLHDAAAYTEPSRRILWEGDALEWL